MFLEPALCQQHKFGLEFLAQVAAEAGIEGGEEDEGGIVSWAGRQVLKGLVSEGDGPGAGLGGAGSESGEALELGFFLGGGVGEGEEGEEGEEGGKKPHCVNGQCVWGGGGVVLFVWCGFVRLLD